MPADPIDARIRGAAKALWRFHCIYDAPKPCDLIVGLGSYDLRVADRCAELFSQGYAGRVVFTGASGNWTRDLYRGSEAAAFGERAIQLGVPDDAVELEERATNIGENIRYVAKLAGDGVRSAVLVTKPQTQRRCHATAKLRWPGVKCMTTSPQHGIDDQPTGAFPMGHLIHEMVGDLYRILIYPKLSYQAPQHVPDDVLAAYELLKSAGYTGHLPDDPVEP